MAEFEIDVRKLTRQAMRSLKWRLRLTRASLVVERVAWCFWPLIAWVLAFFAIGKLGLLLGSTQVVAIAVVGAGVVGFLWLFAKGVRVFRWPSLDEAKARLDADLPGRPLETLQDKLTIGAEDAGARYLWARHLQKMAELARGSKAAVPHVRLAKRDPWAFRLMAVLLFAGAVVFGRSDPVQSLVESLQPDAPVLASGPSWEGWAEPPVYTGKPAVYLNDVEVGKTLELPEGTRITLRVYGAVEGATLTQSVNEADAPALDAGEGGFAETSFEMEKNGQISLVPPHGESAAFDLTVIPDEDPQVALTGGITRTVQGALQMPFEARDDYGVVGGTVTITLALDDVDRRHGLELAPELRETLEIDLPLPFTRKTTSFEETLIEDLAEHPWAGLPVTITMIVRDELGQTGVVVPEIGPMPGKRFFDTLAAAVAEQRRDLLWNRANAERITMILKAITHNPEVAFERRGEKPYLIIRTALRRMEYNSDAPLSDKVRDEVAELLWKAALLIEDGDLADARERLKRAQERLSEAMKNGATDQEIEELMNELRQATRDYMRQLAEEQRNNPDRQQAQNGETQEMSADQLQQMMDRIQELMEQGRMAEAQELMEQLQQMMENMRVTESQNGQGGENQQAMEGLSDTLREQQDLADDTYRELQEQYNQNRQQQQQGQQQGQNQPGQQEGQQPGQQDGEQQGQGQQQGDQPGQQRGRDQQNGQGQGNSPGQLAERQRALRDMLEQQQGEFGRNGLEGGEELAESLREAERQMDEAQRNLEEGDSSGALDNQADAMEALREGMRQLGEAQRQAQSQQQGQQGTQSGQQGQQRDPLGRPLSQSGQVGTNERLLPSEEIFKRSREVMDEIRKRSGDRGRPTLELDYLKRLLDRF